MAGKNAAEHDTDVSSILIYGFFKLSLIMAVVLKVDYDIYFVCKESKVTLN